MSVPKSLFFIVFPKNSSPKPLRITRNFCSFTISSGFYFYKQKYKNLLEKIIYICKIFEKKIL